MPVYYIVTNNGFLKQYYSEQSTNPDDGESEQPSFSASLRNAKMFLNVDEAKSIMLGKNLVNCLIIDQNGCTQTY